MGAAHAAIGDLMMRASLLLFIKAFSGVVALVAVMSGVAQAQPAACHALAASPSDPDRKGPGVSYAKLDGVRAATA